MMETRRLIRPDFESEKRVRWLDPDPLKSVERRRLAEHLPKRMGNAKRAEFLDAVARAVQMARQVRIPDPEAVRREKLQTVAEKSRALLQAIAAIAPDGWGEIRAFSDEFAFDEISPSPVSDQTREAVFARTLLPHFWDTAQDIESIFSHAASQLKPDKQTRLSLIPARALVLQVVAAYRQVTGSWPPYSKDTWFVLFIGVLGPIAQLGDIGRDSIENVIKGMKTRV